MIICDLCKQERDFKVVEKNGKTYVVCAECIDNLPEEEKPVQDAPKSEITPISPGQQLKSEKKKFENKQKAIKQSKKEKELIDIAIKSKCKTLF